MCGGAGVGTQQCNEVCDGSKSGVYGVVVSQGGTGAGDEACNGSKSRVYGVVVSQGGGTSGVYGVVVS